MTGLTEFCLLNFAFKIAADHGHGHLQSSKFGLNMILFV